MITEKDIELLVKLFSKQENLDDEEKKLFDKIKLLSEQIIIQEKYTEELKAIHEKLNELEK